MGTTAFAGYIVGVDHIRLCEMGRFFHDPGLTLANIVFIIYYWSYDISQTFIQHEVDFSAPTLIDWCDFISGECENWLEGMDANGDAIVVEIDESKFFHRKYHRGQWREGHWVFGGIERGSGKCFLVEVPGRRAATLQQHILEHILPGTHIVSDGWAAYADIANIHHGKLAMASESEKVLDFHSLLSPPDLDKMTESTFVAESRIVEVTVGNKVLKIYTEQVVKKDEDPNVDILFLHGMRFSSKNWLEIKSLQHAANWGHRAVAVDLPGYGKSPNTLGPEHNGEFLKSLISALGLERPVIVSPSMSGGFSLPFLFDEPATSTDRAAAYVPVAPVLTSKFVSQFRESQIPTLIVVGTKDTVNGKESTADLKNLPNSIYAPIDGATHPCYLENPGAWHKLFYHFLKHIQH